MALRCKGSECDILNYSVEDYSELIPYLDRLTREDIITALRNYSKSQTALRCGNTASGPTPPRPKLNGGVHKQSSTPRRRNPATPRTGASAGNGNGIFSSRSRFSNGNASNNFPLPGEEFMQTDGDEGDVAMCMTPEKTMTRSCDRRGGLLGDAFPALMPTNYSSEPYFGDGNLLVDVAELDSIDLNDVLNHITDEQSLTYSASEESYLFESVPMDANHTALEHLSGAVLYQEAMPSPDSPHSTFAGGIQNIFLEPSPFATVDPYHFDW